MESTLIAFVGVSVLALALVLAIDGADRLKKREGSSP